MPNTNNTRLVSNVAKTSSGKILNGERKKERERERERDTQEKKKKGEREIIGEKERWSKK